MVFKKRARRDSEEEKDEEEEEEPVKHARTDDTITESCKNCKDIKAYIDKEFKKLKEMISTQHLEVLNAVKQTAKSKDIKSENEDGFLSCSPAPSITFETLKLRFPVETVDDLQEIEDGINGLNYPIYIQVLKYLIRDNIKKNVHDLFGRDLVMVCNVDGTHGKTRFKDFQYVFKALKDALGENDSSGKNAESLIRGAFHNAKKHYYKMTSYKRMMGTMKDELKKDPLNF